MTAAVRAGTGTVLSRHISHDPAPGGSWLLVTLDGRPVPAAQVGPVTIRHGRAQADAPAEPGSCQVMLHAAALGVLPSIGSALRIELSDLALTALGLTGAAAAAALVRFAGDLTDARLVEAPGDPQTDAYLSLVAVGPVARLGRITIGDAPWPAERDGARAGRILSLASGSTGTPVREVDLGTATVLGRDVDSQPPLELLNALAVASRGLLHISRDGSLSWQDAGRRRSAEPVAELHAGQVLRSTGWKLDLTGAVNDVTVAYGPVPDGGEQPTVRVVDALSVGRYGRLGARIATQLATAADAQGLATQLVGRRSTPAWRIDALAVELRRTVPAAVAAQLLTAEPGALLVLTGLPEYGPSSSLRLFLEGWVEQITADGWAVTYDAVPFELLGAGPRWVDIDPATTWGGFPAEVTWLGAAGYFTAPLELGRWVDEPSTRDWTEVDPARTWATA